MPRGRPLGRWVEAASGFVVLVAIVASCSSPRSPVEESDAQAKAAKLVAAAHTEGVAPRLDVETAVALYGTDAPAVCDAFEGGLSTSARNLLLGNPAHGRRKTITVDAVAYGRLVVRTYCPDRLRHYDRAVEALDPFGRRDR